MSPVSKMTSYQNFAFILVTIFFSVSAWLLIKIPSAYQSEVDFKAHAVSTTGTVKKTEVDQYWVYSGSGTGAGQWKTEYTSTIQFETLTGEAATLSHSTSTPLGGKQVSILYNPTYPNQARVGTEVNPKNTVYGYLLASVFFLVGGIYTLYYTHHY